MGLKSYSVYISVLLLAMFVFIAGCEVFRDKDSSDTGLLVNRLNMTPIKDSGSSSTVSQAACTISPAKLEKRAQGIREPAVSGYFYPSSARKLRQMIDTFLDKADISTEVSQSHISGIIVPHAGYVYSGGVAAYAYKSLKGKRYKTVILVGPSHTRYFPGVSVNIGQDYKTPLGIAVTDVSLGEKLMEEAPDIVKYFKEAHEREHSLEVQIPFIQTVLPDVKILVAVIGDQSAKIVNKFADALYKVISERDDVLLLASSDYSHYYDYNTAVSIDKRCISLIKDYDIDTLIKEVSVRDGKSCEMCGGGAAVAVLKALYKKGCRAKNVELLKYANSGDVTGDKSRVVGYAAFVIHGCGFDGKKKKDSDDILSKDEKEFLLRLARRRLESVVRGTKFDAINPDLLTEELVKKKGCFVTLNKHSMLRGCIGYILPRKPLYQCVIDNTVNAALHDSRFSPVQPDELDDIEIEISVLTVPKQLEYDNSDELLRKLRPGIDGVILSSGWHSSTYLPQVWEQLPDKIDFLTRLCLKGGMSKDCWKKSTTEIKTYQALVFSEKDIVSQAV